MGRGQHGKVDLIAPRLPMLSRRLVLFAPVPGLAVCAWPFHATAQTDAPPMLAAVQLLVGVERTAKLHLKRRLLNTRAAQESAKERQRIEAASRLLLEQPKALQRLSERRRTQISAAVQAAADFAAAPPDSAGELLRESEALAPRLGFVSTALAGLSTDPARAAQLDLLARAGSSALRIGKFNLAAAAGSPRAELRVSATQALTEFSAALQSVGEQDLQAGQRRELQLVRHQWTLFIAALGSDGLARDAQALADIASTTDRMAETLASMARRGTA